jgi:hypothetical protein
MAIKDPFVLYPETTMPSFVRHILVVPDNTNFIGQSVEFPEGVLTRGIRCDADGTAILEDTAGNILTYTLIAGEQIPGRFLRCRVGSTATLHAWF